MACIDTLRLSAADRAALLQTLERESPAYRVHANLRAHKRVPYESAAVVVMKLCQPGGSSGLYLVRPRNISRGGVAFLHGSYIHRDSRCGLLLRTLKGEPHPVDGRVLWCRHVSGRVHEVGVEFDQPIDLAELVENCLRADEDQQQSRELPSLSGRVVHVEPRLDDRELLRFHLGQLGLALHEISDARQATALVRRVKPDLIVTGTWGSGETGPALVTALRSDGYAGPILALSADDRASVRDEAHRWGCREVLGKPWSFEGLVAALRRHLPAPGSPRPLASSHWDNQKMRPVILRFLGRLEEQLRQIGGLIEQDGQSQALQQRCTELKGSAGGYGFEPISHAAAALASLAEQGSSTAALRAQFAELQHLGAAACRTTKAQQGAA